MLEVGYSARRERVPGPLSKTIIDVAHTNLDLWREDERSMALFGQLPELVASACWRLIVLLEYLSSLDGSENSEDLL